MLLALPTCSYAHLRDSKASPACRQMLVKLMRSLTSLLRQLYPYHIKMMMDFLRGHEPLGPGTGPFCTISLTVNYFNPLHLDEQDPPLSFITWWLTGSGGELIGGAFRLPNLLVRFTPLHGTVLLINTIRIIHGTQPSIMQGLANEQASQGSMGAKSGQPGLQRIGSALWMRAPIIRACEQWRLGATKVCQEEMPLECSYDAEATEVMAKQLWEAKRKGTPWSAEAARATKKAKQQQVVEGPAQLRCRIMNVGAGLLKDQDLFDEAAVHEWDGCWDVSTISPHFKAPVEEHSS